MGFYPPPASDTTIMPFERTVGHELEFSSGVEVVRLMREKGVGTPALPDRRENELHWAHCDCNLRDEYPVHTTSDSTARGGEYLIGGSQGVLYGSDTYVKAIRAISVHAQAIECGTNSSVGMHTHVGTTHPKTGESLNNEQKLNVLRAYVRYQPEIWKLAAFDHTLPRNNGCMEREFKLGSWLSYYANGISETKFWDAQENTLRVDLPGRPTINFQTGRPTIEFRIWNSTVAAWRMYLAGGVSAALVEAAAQGRRAHPDTEGTLVDFLQGLLTPDLLVLIDRQISRRLP